MPLLPFQARWIADKSTIKICEKSRRIGITWTEAGDAALDAGKRSGKDWWYVGYNHEMAQEFIDYAADWARLLNVSVAEQKKEILIRDETQDILSYRINFASGHSVTALSSRPANLRGKTGVAIIDEAAYHEDLAGLLKAARAFTMWGGAIHMISTHNGTDNAFAELINDIRSGRRKGSIHRITIDDALADGLYQEIARVEGLPDTPEAQAAWRAELLDEYGADSDEELFCIPSRGGGVFLPAELIESCMRDGIPVIRGRGDNAAHEIEAELDNAIRTRLHPELMSCFGEDFGRSGDLTVIWPLQLTADLKRVTPFVVELRDVEYEQQWQILRTIVDALPRFFAGAMDATGNGGWLAEAAGKRYGRETDEHPGRIKGVMLNVEWYRENMPKYKDAFEKKRILLPHHADILADHKLLRMEKGVARVPDNRTKGTDAGQRHGDSAIAGALAYFASASSQSEYAYTPIVAARVPVSPKQREDDHEGFGARGWGSGRLRLGRGAW